MQVCCIIDGNYILSKTVFTLHKNNILYGSLLQVLNNSISNYRKIYPFTKVLLVSDSKEKSWRKSIDPNYKSKRKRDSDIDWQFVYSTYDEFKSNLSGVTVLESPNIEGDDWISYAVHHLNKSGFSTVIISNDHDIKQLIKYDINEMWINIMTNEMMYQERVFLPHNYQIFLNKVKYNTVEDIFNLNTDSEFLTLFKSFTSKYIISEIDNVESLFVKLVSGDSSDNIESAYQVIKNGKKRGIGQKGAQTIYDMYKTEFGQFSLNDPDFIDNISDVICDKKKISKTNMSSISEKLLHNLKMVDLRFEKYPTHIIEKMKEKKI